MNHRSQSFLVIPLLGTAAVMTGCLQPWDSRAASQSGNVTAVDENDHTIVLEEPAKEITPGDQGGLTTDDPCAVTEFQVLNNDEKMGPLGILAKDCGGCHNNGAAQGGFDWVLDPARLTSTAPADMPPSGVVDVATGEKWRFIVPGEPNRSRLYVRVVKGEMPKPDVAGLPKNTFPTVSDMSVLNHWISKCLGASPPPVMETSDGGAPPEGTGGANGRGTGGANGGGTGGASGGGTGGASSGGGTGGVSAGTGGAAGAGAGGRAFGGRTGRAGAGAGGAA